MFLFAKKLGNLTGGVDKIVPILYKRKRKLKEVKSITRGNCPSKRSKALSLPSGCSALRRAQESDTALHHLLSSRICSSASRQEPECRKRHFKIFFWGAYCSPKPVYWGAFLQGRELGRQSLWGLWSARAAPTALPGAAPGWG